MKSYAVIVLSLVSCLPGQAQAPAASQLTPNVRIYEPKNLTPDRAMRVANFVNTLINGGHVQWEEVPHAIVIRATTPGELETAEAMVRRFDVPEPKPTAATQYDCTVYLIRASHAAASGTPIPAELQPAIAEMKRTFDYDSYTLWDAIPIQPNGAGDIQGVLPGDPAPNGPSLYSVAYTGSGAGGGVLAMNGFRFSVRVPSEFYRDGMESHITTDVKIREGQKLVLGKIRLMPAQNADLFVVLTTKAR